ncbi:MAG: hypothetical protein FJ088_03485, partial [Deltaproteobacteria bacterium]|nr:hypothetical protein [Deltaproteobacteria bacterium]
MLAISPQCKKKEATHSPSKVLKEGIPYAEDAYKGPSGLKPDAGTEPSAEEFADIALVSFFSGNDTYFVLREGGASNVRLYRIANWVFYAGGGKWNRFYMSGDPAQKEEWNRIMPGRDVPDFIEGIKKIFHYDHLFAAENGNKPAEFMSEGDVMIAATIKFIKSQDFAKSDEEEGFFHWALISFVTAFDGSITFLKFVNGFNGGTHNYTDVETASFSLKELKPLEAAVPDGLTKIIEEQKKKNELVSEFMGVVKFEDRGGFQRQVVLFEGGFGVSHGTMDAVVLGGGKEETGIFDDPSDTLKTPWGAAITDVYDYRCSPDWKYCMVLKKNSSKDEFEHGWTSLTDWDFLNKRKKIPRELLMYMENSA